MKQGVASRVAAAGVLGKVIRSGAYSNVIIHQATDELSGDDARFVQRLVFDGLRHLLFIDEVIERLSRPIAELDDEVADVLRVLITDLMFLRTPAYAAVDASVEAAAEVGKPKARSFVNAIGRRVARQRDALIAESADASTMPRWIRERLDAQYGAEAVAMVEALDSDTRTGLRIRPGSPDVGDPVPGIGGARWVGPGDAGPLVAAGTAIVADPASVAVGNAVGAQPGETILDMASAPGGKTAHLWDAMGGSGTLVAADSHERRLARARARLAKADIHPAYVVMDGARPSFGPETFDRVLLDAPCSGLGTLRRRPEIRHRLGPGDPEKLGMLQRSLLEAALRLVKPGGVVVYSVCTVFTEETTDVVEPYGGTEPEGTPGTPMGAGVLLAPHTTQTDGMFISVVRP